MEFHVQQVGATMETIREQLKSYLGSSTAPTCSNR